MSWVLNVQCSPEWTRDHHRWNVIPGGSSESEARDLAEHIIVNGHWRGAVLIPPRDIRCINIFLEEIE